MGKMMLGYVIMVGPAVHSVLKATVLPVSLDSWYGAGSLIGGWVGSVVGVLIGLAITMSASNED